jgi:transposase
LNRNPEKDWSVQTIHAKLSRNNREEAMARKKLTMRKVHEILRLKDLGLTQRQIANSLKISHSTVGRYLSMIESHGVSAETDEEALQAILYPPRKPDLPSRPDPDWETIQKELNHKGVTRKLLWMEYREEYPDGYSYSQFCERFNRWQKKTRKPTWRRPVKPGEKVEVDYAGMTVDVVDPKTGEIRKAQMFIGVIGASGLIYAEAHWHQNLANWTGAHVRMFKYFGGLPEYIVPDNLKAGVKSPCYYDPDINPTYHELAVHYGVAVLPARVKKPKDKGLGENAVQQAERWILAPLRHQKYFSLYDLNQDIAGQLQFLNQRERSDNGRTRQDLFEELDRPVLKPLPNRPFEYLEVKTATVHIDYHVQFHGHFYSVPHALIGQKVLLKASEHTVTIYAQYQVVASHLREDRHGYSTTADHMPHNHRFVSGWSPQRFLRWAEKVGPETRNLIAVMLESRRHPQQQYRSCLGVLKLADRHSPELLEAACARALEIQAPTWRVVKNLLENQKDMLAERIASRPPINHKHVRGDQYYT